jgi:hypothetical protein
MRHYTAWVFRAEYTDTTMSDYLEIESHLHKALDYKRQHPAASFQWLECQFRVRKDRLHHCWKGIQNSKSECNPTNQKFDAHQDKAFCWYLTSLREIRVPLQQKTMAAAANEILAAAYSRDEPPTNGEH